MTGFTPLSERNKMGGARWISQSELAEIYRKLMPYSPDGSLTITPTAAGIAIQGGATGGGVPMQVTSQLLEAEAPFDPVHGYYNVTVYGAGSTAASTGIGIVKILQLAAGEVVPNGTWIIGTKLGSNDDFPLLTHYEGQVPVWL